MSPILGIWASQGKMLTDFESIATVTLNSSQSTISFTSIPSTYKHLQLRGFTHSTAAFSESLLKTQFNGDTASNYAFHQIRGDGSGTSSAAYTSQTSIWIQAIPENGSGTSVFGGFIMDILDYANTNKNKTTRLLTGYDANGSGRVYFMSGLWQSTAAITSISIDGTYDSGQFAQYTSIALYGIKG